MRDDQEIIMNERIRLLQDYIQQLNDAGVRYTRFYNLIAASLKETVGEPVPLRRAKAFAYLLENVEQVVLPYELLCGSILGAWPVDTEVPSYAERKREALTVVRSFIGTTTDSDTAIAPRGYLYRLRENKARWALMSRDHYDANIDFGELQRLIKEVQEEVGANDNPTKQRIARTLEEHFEYNYGEETHEVISELPWTAANHLDLHYGKVVRTGLGPIKQRLLERAALSKDEEERTYAVSQHICIEAAISFINRYAQTLRSEASEKSCSANRAEELEEMAAVCEKISEDAPENFREALQLLWMVHIIQSIAGGSALSFARFDQYMYPFFKRDCDCGQEARERIRELLCCMWIKINEPKMRTVQSICLAGLTPEGGEGANELTSLCLEVTQELKLPYPNVAVRMTEAGPDWLLDRVTQTVTSGSGHPMVLNDSVWVPNFIKLGYKPEHARDYYNMGCVEMMIQGRQPVWVSTSTISFPELLLRQLREASDGPEQDANGQAVATLPPGAPDQTVATPLSGAPDQTGDRGDPDCVGDRSTGGGSFSATFDRFFESYLDKIQDEVAARREEAERMLRERKESYYDPFASLFIDDCLESGKDLFRGGTVYGPPIAVGGSGLGTAVDSLSVIKQYVYEKKDLTFHELFSIIENDFEGHDQLRLRFANNPCCFGNDIEWVDELAARMVNVLSDSVHRLNNVPIDGKFVTRFFSYNDHVFVGEVTPATPNGRRCGETLSDNMGPTQGKDVNGPTKLLNSVLKPGPHNYTGAVTCNLKINPAMVKDENGITAFKALIKTYLKKGGPQIQFNLVDQKILEDAQEHPDKHRDLIVRIAGYCEFFVNLDRELQTEIIRRSVH